MPHGRFAFFMSGASGVLASTSGLSVRVTGLTAQQLRFSD